MKLRNIAVKNLLRRKSKSAFLLTGLVIGIATVVAIYSFIQVMSDDINNKLEKFGANILIVPKTENLALTYGDFSVAGVSYKVEEIKQTDLEDIKRIEYAANVAAVGPMVLGGVSVNNKQVLLAGVDFSVSYILKPWWKLSGPQPTSNEIILGASAAHLLNVKAGDELKIASSVFYVKKVLEVTGSQDEKLIFADLAIAQEILNKKGKISMAEVAALCKDCPIDTMVKQIGKILPGAKVMAIQQVVKSRMTALNQFKSFSYGVSAVIIFIGSLIVLITMMGNVKERSGEIGIFRAIGFRKSHVMKVILCEVLIISLLAGIIGFLIGYAVSITASGLFINNGQVKVLFNIDLAFGALFLSIIIGILSSLYPALMASQLDPVETLRSL